LPQAAASHRELRTGNCQLFFNRRGTPMKNLPAAGFRQNRQSSFINDQSESPDLRGINTDFLRGSTACLRFLYQHPDMPSHGFCQSHRHRVADLLGDMFVRPRKHIAIWERLQGRRFTKANGAVLCWMAVSAVR